jgi:hypothetical protein
MRRGPARPVVEEEEDECEKESCDEPCPEAESKASEGGAEISFEELAQELEGRSISAARLYQAPPTTKEYEERGYYDITSSSTVANASIIQMTSFWADFATYAADPSSAIINGDSKDEKTAMVRILLLIRHR